MPHTKNMNLMKLNEHFHSEERCREHLEGLRWPDGLRCPRCESGKVGRSYKRDQLVCSRCDYNFSVTSGTIFHDTHLPLTKWLNAIYLILESKKGISANQMKRTLGVSYKTAWYLCHRIRKAIEEASPQPLSGTVEVDETYVGGKVRGRGHGYKGNKAIVVGAVERGGKIVLKVVPGTDTATLQGFVTRSTAPDTVAIYTDEHASYRGIGDDDTRHETVQHGIGEYVRGDVHTNSVEGVWSLFKRSVIGSYHKVSVKHLDAYLDELEWRFNNRHNPYLFRDTLMKLLQAEKLEYKTLIAEG